MREDEQEQARLVQRDFDRMKVVKHAQHAANAPCVVDSPIVDGGQGKSAEQVEFSARTAFFCALLLAATIVAALIWSVTK